MTKKIVLFSDGTGNSSAKSQKTNVWRMYRALDLSPDLHQIAFYDDGVGTSSFRPLAILGGAFGFGLARNVRQIYTFVCRTYEREDEIYGFGFSRGAFTMRVVSAFISNQGIIDINNTKGERDLKRQVKAAYRCFRRDMFPNSAMSWALRPLRNGLIHVKDFVLRNTPYDPTVNIEHPQSKGPNDEDPKKDLIRFLGVWDTVDAYGLPIDEMTRAWDRLVWPLSAKDRDLSERVHRACHALALDEQRQTFEPMLWNEAVESKQIDAANIADERVTQVWFAGVHSNVGGGYPDDALSHVSLNWMMRESGLKFLTQEHKRLWAAANANGKIYDSRKGVGTFYRYQPRKFEKLCNDQMPGFWNWIKSWGSGGESSEEMNEVHIRQPKIHYSVLDRLQSGGDAYSPINLPAKYAVVQADGEIVEQINKNTSDSNNSSGNGDKNPGECVIKDPSGDNVYINRRLPEDLETAQTRRHGQELVWNKVWLRRVVYGLTICALLLLALFPFVAPDLDQDIRIGVNQQTQSEANDDSKVVQQGFPNNLKQGISALNDGLDVWLGTFGPVLQSAPKLIGNLPGLGFAKPFFDKYSDFPYILLIFFLVIGLLIFWSSRLKLAIEDCMRANWGHVAKLSKGHLPAKSALRQRLANIRTSKLYQDWLSPFLRIIGESVAWLFFLAALIVVISRIALITLDGVGLVCAIPENADKSYPDKEGVKLDFRPESACFPQPKDISDGTNYIELEAGKKYRIEMKLGGEWVDGNKPGIPADLYGWLEERPEMSLFVPLRRHLFLPWYQPVFRIGNKKYDRYPLVKEDVPEDKNRERKNCLSMTFEARSTGPLYVYLNDAVLFTPHFPNPLEFYSNNDGDSAEIVVSLEDTPNDAPTNSICIKSNENNSESTSSSND